MALKPGKSIDEICYPFIYEAGSLCDYEVITDELCAVVGGILTELHQQHAELAADLETLQPMIFHANASIRGRLALDEGDLKWLLERYRHYKKLTEGRVNGFVLPRGPEPVAQLHQARSAAKKAIRVMVRIDQEGIAVPDVLHRFCNVLCNFFFVLTLYINQAAGIEETAFHSRSYGRPEHE
jgi:cob(I)alamin adenosyltransferase